MIKIKCKKCGRDNITYSPPKFCQYCHVIFKQSEQTKSPDRVSRQIIKPDKKPAHPARKKKPLTLKQKKFYADLSDKMQSAKQSMVDHIMRHIGAGYYTDSEFFNDPTVYFDSAVMGKFIKNSVMKKQIIKAVQDQIYGPLVC